MVRHGLLKVTTRVTLGETLAANAAGLAGRKLAKTGCGPPGQARHGQMRPALAVDGQSGIQGHQRLAGRHRATRAAGGTGGRRGRRSPRPRSGLTGPAPVRRGRAVTVAVTRTGRPNSDRCLREETTITVAGARERPVAAAVPWPPGRNAPSWITAWPGLAAARTGLGDIPVLRLLTVGETAESVPAVTAGLVAGGRAAVWQQSAFQKRDGDERDNNSGNTE